MKRFKSFFACFLLSIFLLPSTGFSYTGQVVKQHKTPGKISTGMTYDGKYFWISDRISNEIYMVSPENGSVIVIAQAPGEFTRGLAFFGESLWAADSQTDAMYQLKVDDIHAAIPKDRPNQEIEGEISYSLEYTSMVTDHFSDWQPRE